MTTTQFDTTERSLRREIRWDLITVVLVVVGALAGLGATNDAARTALAATSQQQQASPALLSLGGPKRPPRPIPPVHRRTEAASAELALSGPRLPRPLPPQPPRPLPPIHKIVGDIDVG